MRKAMTLLEVVISLGMLAVIMSVVFPVMGWLITKSKQLEYENQAGVVMATGMEVAYNVLLSDWNGVAPGGTYQPGTAVGGEGLQWTLVNGTGLAQARFTRWIEVSEVCRDAQTGERVGCDAGDVDQNSKLLKSYVRWTEKQAEKTISSELLMVKL